MKTMIDSIHRIIDKLSNEWGEMYYRHKYRMFYKGHRSYYDDAICGVKGRLAILFVRISNRIKGISKQ